MTGPALAIDAIKEAVAHKHFTVAVKKIAATHERGLITDDEMYQEVGLALLQADAQIHSGT